MWPLQYPQVTKLMWPLQYPQDTKLMWPLRLDTKIMLLLLEATLAMEAMLVTVRIVRHR